MRVLFCAILILATGLATAQTPMPDLYGFQHMGAGVPAGWKLDGTGYTWTPETRPGPLGPGAVRLILGAHAQLKLESPALVLPAGTRHGTALWLRAEPADVTVRLRMADNNDEHGAVFNDTLRASKEWKHVAFAFTPSHGLKNQYYLTITIEGANTALWLDGLWVGPSTAAFDEDWQPTLFPATANLAPDAPFGLVTGDAPLRIKACVAGTVPKGSALHLHLTHVTGAQADLPPLPIEESGVWLGAANISDPAANAFGMMRIESTVTGPDGQALSPKAETLLARAPEPVPGPCPDSPFGIHVQLREPDLAVAAKLGYKWCRIHDASSITKWGYIEPTPGNWEWHDDDVALAHQYGLSILGMLDTAPRWETGVEDNGYFAVCHKPNDPAHWKDYVRQVVGHYAGAIDAWEVWNEPWDSARFLQGGNVGDYFNLLKDAYGEAKQANPKCAVVGIDTYPPIWDQILFAAGAQNFCDAVSWHRYDSNLAGRPGDNIAHVADRLRGEMGASPKPLWCTEGGLDVTHYQGSFFSFAAPQVTGDWSLGPDRYTRWFLSALAAGNERFIAYSMHGVPRFGQPSHMTLEPGPLLRPLHLALAGLAHFTEGAKYDTRLVPAQDISAHVFRKPNQRREGERPREPQSTPESERPREPQQTASPDTPSIVVALHADGLDPEPLPKPLPAGIQCFDRWANPCDAPTQATVSPVYLVASGESANALLDTLRGETPDAPAPASDPNTAAQTLLDTTLASLTKNDPPLWTLCSVQGAVVIRGGAQAVVTPRAQLRNDPAKAATYVLPEGATASETVMQTAGRFTFGSAKLTAPNGETGALAFIATPDGKNGALRHVALAYAPATPAIEPAKEKGVTEILQRWERALVDANTHGLHANLYNGPCCAAASTANGEYFVFDDPEQLITMMDTVVVWGADPTSKITPTLQRIGGGLALVQGEWTINSLAFGLAPYYFSAMMIEDQGTWRLVGLCLSAAT